MVVWGRGGGRGEARYDGKSRQRSTCAHLCRIIVITHNYFPCADLLRIFPNSKHSFIFLPFLSLVVVCLIRSALSELFSFLHSFFLKSYVCIYVHLCTLFWFTFCFWIQVLTKKQKTKKQATTSDTQHSKTDDVRHYYKSKQHFIVQCLSRLPY